MQSPELQALQDLFKDTRQHIAIGKILRMTLASDKSSLKCYVSIWPEEREIIATMTWEAVGPESGIFSFPVPGDLVLVIFPDGEVDQAFIIKRLTSRVDKIPATAADGSLVMKALAGTKAWLTSDSRINLSKGDTAPTENLVLGQQLKILLSDILNKLSDLSVKISTHTHVGNLGYPTSAPNEAADFITLQGNFDDIRSSPVEDEMILSDLAFTEKGS